MPEPLAIAFPHMVNPPEPTQARSKQAFERLLQVGEQLLAENRFDEIGVADLAKLAETSVGTFYRLLNDKDTLSRLLLQRFFSDMVTQVEALTELHQWRSAAWKTSSAPWWRCLWRSIMAGAACCAR